MSCLENLRLAWEGSGRRTAGRKGFSQAVEGLVDFVPELEGYLHRRGGELSGGQQQLVAVARAWIARPRVLLLDEPTLGLAPTNAERINLLIGQLARSQSVTALVVEENVDLSVRLCDRMYLMRSSEIVAELATADAEARDDVVKRMVFGLSV
jgi:branched-chain amino acid transport system ATP-binding protein